MMRRLLISLALALGCVAAAGAQPGTTTTTYGAPPTHRFELIPLGGYCWTFAQDVYVGSTYGKVDFKDAAYYGAALDVNTMRRSSKELQVRLLYRRSDSKVQVKLPGERDRDVDAFIEFWQVGGVAGYRRGPALPFSSLTLGGARLGSGSDDSWKFAMTFGLGVKYYASPKVGVMIQGNFPIAFTDTWGGVSVGTGGAGLAIGGTGISQIDIGGGLVILF